MARSYAGFADIYHFLYKTLTAPGCSEGDYIKLQSRSDDFKKLSLQTFSAYEDAGMETYKWHSIDHLIEYLKDVGGVESLPAGLY